MSSLDTEELLSPDRSPGQSRAASPSAVTSPSASVTPARRLAAANTLMSTSTETTAAVSPPRRAMKPRLTLPAAHPQHDDALLRSLLVPTPSPRRGPHRFDAGMTRPRSQLGTPSPAGSGHPLGSSVGAATGSCGSGGFAGVPTAVAPPPTAGLRSDPTARAFPQGSSFVLARAPGTGVRAGAAATATATATAGTGSGDSVLLSHPTAPAGLFSHGHHAAANVETRADVGASTNAGLSLDGLGIKYPLRVLYATGEVFKDQDPCFLWRQIVHQLTFDMAYCFHASYVGLPRVPEDACVGGWFCLTAVVLCGCGCGCGCVWMGVCVGVRVCGCGRMVFVFALVAAPCEKC